MRLLIEAHDFLDAPARSPPLPYRDPAVWREREGVLPAPAGKGARPRCTGAQVCQILRVLDARVGDKQLSELWERVVRYTHDLMYSDRGYDELTAEGEEILQMYVEMLATMFPLERATQDEQWYRQWATRERKPPTDAAKEALATIAYRSWDVCFFASAYMGLRHGAHLRRIIRDPAVARLFHEEGGEHAWTWVYYFVSLMGTVISDSFHETDAIAFVIFAGSLAGNPPFSARGRRVRALNRTYARAGGHVDPVPAS